MIRNSGEFSAALYGEESFLLGEAAYRWQSSQQNKLCECIYGVYLWCESQGVVVFSVITFWEVKSEKKVKRSLQRKFNYLSIAF